MSEEAEAAVVVLRRNVQAQPGVYVDMFRASSSPVTEIHLLDRCDNHFLPLVARLSSVKLGKMKPRKGMAGTCWQVNLSERM